MKRDRYKKNTWIDLIAIIFVIPLFISFVLGVLALLITFSAQIIGANFYRSDEIITVQFKEVFEVRSLRGKKEVLRVYAKTQDDVYERFEIRRRLPSTGILEVGCKYKVKTAGFRLSYSRIIKEIIEQIECEDNDKFVPICDKMKYTPDFMERVVLIMILVPCGFLVIAGAIFLPLEAIGIIELRKPRKNRKVKATDQTDTTENKSPY
jgi:hypothetical protein